MKEPARIYAIVGGMLMQGAIFLVAGMIAFGNGMGSFGGGGRTGFTPGAFWLLAGTAQLCATVI